MPPPKKKVLSLADRISASRKVPQEELDREKQLLDQAVTPRRTPAEKPKEELPTAPKTDKPPQTKSDHSPKQPGSTPPGELIPDISDISDKADSRYQVSGISDIADINLPDTRYPISDINLPDTRYQISGISSQNQENTKEKTTNNIVLPTQQAKVLAWFQRQNRAGVFNKVKIAEEAGVKHPTVRIAIDALVDKKLLWVGKYDYQKRVFPYKLRMGDEEVVSEDQVQVQNVRADTRYQISGISLPDTRYPISDIDPLIKKERKIINKSFCLRAGADISAFWEEQGVTEKRCEDWLTEFGIPPEVLKMQLTYAEHTQEVRAAKKPMSYFYQCLKRGGVPKPPGYETPDERRARLQQEMLEDKKKALEAYARATEELKALEEEEAFNKSLEDPAQIEAMIREMETNYMTPKKKILVQTYRETGKLGGALRVALKNEFFRKN